MNPTSLEKAQSPVSALCYVQNRVCNADMLEKGYGGLNECIIKREGSLESSAYSYGKIKMQFININFRPSSDVFCNYCYI